MMFAGSLTENVARHEAAQVGREHKLEFARVFGGAVREGDRAFYERAPRHLQELGPLPLGFGVGAVFALALEAAVLLVECEEDGWFV